MKTPDSRYFSRVTAILAIACAGLFTTVRAEAATTVPLFAGQTIEVGSVTVSNDADFVYVTYLITAPGWEITETHVAFGRSLLDIPATGSGSPKVGNFPLSGCYSPGVTAVTYSLPMALFQNNRNPYFAAHAVVALTGSRLVSETAWAAGFPFPGSNWATYFGGPTGSITSESLGDVGIDVTEPGGDI
jgi:hypothetical protein